MKSWHVKFFPLFVHSMLVKVDKDIQHTSWCGQQAIYCVFQILLSFTTIYWGLHLIFTWAFIIMPWHVISFISSCGSFYVIEDLPILDPWLVQVLVLESSNLNFDELNSLYVLKLLGFDQLKFTFDSFNFSFAFSESMPKLVLIAFEKTLRACLAIN